MSIKSNKAVELMGFTMLANRPLDSRKLCKNTCLVVDERINKHTKEL